MKEKLLRIGKIVLLGTLVLGGLVILGFVNASRKHARCWKFDVQIDHSDGTYFIDEADVKKKVFSLGDSLIGSAINDIDVETIHQKVLEIPAVKSADVYKTVDGRISVSVFQCRPLARFINADGSGFYLDTEGGIVPLSKHFTAHVPVFTGNIYEGKGKGIHELALNPELSDKSIIDDAFRIIEYINSDSFWKAQLDHIYVNADYEFEIVPRVGNHRILIGKGEQLELQLKKMMAFYEKVLPTRGIDQYKSIDLRFKGQVVCRK